MVDLFGNNHKQFNKKEKPKNEMYSLIYFYLRLQNQEPNQVLAKRYLRDMSDLLKLGTPAEIKLRCIEVKKYAEKQGISWSLNYVIKSWGKFLGSQSEIREKLYDEQLQREYAENDRKQKAIDEAYKRSLNK
jgi:hypothetical protein